MIDLTVAQIADIVGGTLADISPEEAAQCHVTGTVEFDSRAVGPGGLFLALPGRTRRPRLCGSAVAAGAVAVLAARPVGVPAIVVAPAGDRGPQTAGVLEHDTDGSGAAVLSALARLARAVAEELVTGGLTIVGITGSSGKTSTKDLVAAVLGTLGEVVAPPGSFNNELGHPWTVLRATRDTDYLILEMSARHPGNIAELAAIAPPAIGWCSTSAPRTWVSLAHRRPSHRLKPNCRKLFRRPVWSSSTPTTQRWPPWLTSLPPGSSASVATTPVTCGPARCRWTNWPGRVSPCTPATPKPRFSWGVRRPSGHQRAVRGCRRAALRRQHRTGGVRARRRGSGVAAPDAGDHPI